MLEMDEHDKNWQAANIRFPFSISKSEERKGNSENASQTLDFLRNLRKVAFEMNVTKIFL